MIKSLTNTTDLFSDGIIAWGSRIRAGELSFADTMRNCLSRASDLEKLNAFECINTDKALDTAKAYDQLLQSGTDFGPLMGLPIGIKDIISVNGLPTTNGSNADTAHLSGTEGAVVNALRAAGGIVFGKTRTVEFALGATGVNESRGTPWNPVDLDVHRIPGGSSSGSAVAVAAGIVGLALGTDTGGSIRIPACFTGIVGHKTSVGRWPTGGIFPLSPTLDSVGPLCRQVSDAAILHTLMTGEPVHARDHIAGLRFATPSTLFLDDLDEAVLNDFERACKALEAAGAHRVDVDFPEVLEREYLFPNIVGPEIIHSLGEEFFRQIQADVDTVTAQRAAHGLTVSATTHLAAQSRRKHLMAKAAAQFSDVDCWITPTCPFVPMPLASFDDPAQHTRGLLSSRNTQPGNLLNLCGVSLPMHQDGLPTGLQILMPDHADAKLLGLANAVTAALR